MLKSINPATEELIQSYEIHNTESIAKAVISAHAEFPRWRKTLFTDRAQLLRKLAEVLEKDQEKYAALINQEMGKPQKQGIAEVEKCAWVCRYYAENGERFLSHDNISTDAHKSFISFQPLGVILAVMPWNFPFWQVFRFAVPALMAGNVILLKHATNVSGCALAIEEIFQTVGFPKHAFLSLLINSDAVAALIEKKEIAAVTLTGSTSAGKKVAAIAGANLKKCVLELGGSDPYIILADADLEKAAHACATSRLINSGQSCIAAKRFIVMESIKKSFVHLLTQEMEKQKNDIGPLARKDLREELHRQVSDSIAEGAKLQLGGTIPKQRGYFYPPTILTDVKPGMPAYHEELFGPVAAVISVKTVEEAIAVANDTSFGLGAAIFTQNNPLGLRLAENEVEAGSCFINSFVRSDPRLPFGGIKESGYGRELSVFGIREFVNVKTIYLA